MYRLPKYIYVLNYIHLKPLFISLSHEPKQDFKTTFCNNYKECVVWENYILSLLEHTVNTVKAF